MKFYYITTFYRASLSLEAPNYCLCIHSNSAGFSFINTGKQVHLKQARRAPSKCCIKKLVKKLETRGSRSNACRLLSLGPIEEQSVQKYTPHNRTTQRRYTPKIQAVNFDALGTVFQNLDQRIQVRLDVKGDQFQHR